MIKRCHENGILHDLGIYDNNIYYMITIDMQYDNDIRMIMIYYDNDIRMIMIYYDNDIRMIMIQNDNDIQVFII